jgi:hypothetical protein
MTADTNPATPGTDLATNQAAAASTFNVIDVPDITIPQIIAAIIDDNRDAIKWPEAGEGAERAVLERLAAATSTAELFGDQDGMSWRELLDTPVEVHGFRLLPSTLDNGVVFAVVDVYRLDEGERTVVTTSARGVLVQLLQGVLVGAVPGVFKLTEVGKETKGRSRPQRLVRLGDLGESASLDLPF